MNLGNLRNFDLIRDWAPVGQANGLMTFTVTAVNIAKYVVVGKVFFYQVELVGTTAGTASNAIGFTLPAGILAQIGAGNPALAGVVVVDGGGSIAAFGYMQSASIAYALKSDGTNFGLGTNRILRASGSLIIH